MYRVVCLVIGYAIGCIQTAFIVGKLMGKIDIREYGSGNAGTTNITRVLGPKAGAIVFVGDILKGVIAYTICSLLFNGDGSFFQGETILPGIYAGLGVILGHDFPFYLKFKGGKGIASTLGIILCIDLKIAAITYLIGFLIVVITKYISLSSLIMALVVTVLLFVYKFNTEAGILMAVLAILAYYQHIPNIKRLIKGKENKFSIKSKYK